MSELTITRTFNVNRERLFDAFADPSILKDWWGPHGCSASAVAMDLRIGGKYEIVMNWPNKPNVYADGEYLAIDRPNNLQFTWTWRGSEVPSMDGILTQISITFRKLTSSSTELEFTHSMLPNEKEVESHIKGWTNCLEVLDAHMMKSETAAAIL
jgi:uncharacterized protein YndB with AHSA1/START domain